LRASIVSCVNDFDKYDLCVRSSFHKDCETGSVELLPVDNTSNSRSAPAALNMGFAQATGKIIVFCHQDVVFPEGWIQKLYEQISIIEQTHEKWGVLGTFGVANNGMFAGHIIDPSGHFYCQPLPAEVQSLDEHCLIVSKDSGLCFDETIEGFHLYGADICVQALARGLTNFAIDACVSHLSSGNVDDDFSEATNKLYQKWRYMNPPLSVIQTTCKMFRLRSGFRGKAAYRIARFKRKRKRKKVQGLLKAGHEFRKLHHDSI
jgi:hypothetical protein